MASWQALLREPNRSDHVVQLYTDDAFLGRAVGEFLGTGLDRAEGAAVIATPDHIAVFAERLAAQGAVIAALIDRSQLLVFDAAASLAEFMAGDTPDADRFFALVRGIAARFREAGYPTFRLYGELVDLLWQRNLPAAIRLEQLWNEALAGESATLLCACRIDAFDWCAQRGAVPRIAHVHSHMIPVENSDRFEAAVTTAHDEVFGAQGEAAAFRELLVSSYPSPAVMPRAQAAVLALATVDPAAAGEVLRRARRYYYENGVGAVAVSQPRRVAPERRAVGDAGMLGTRQRQATSPAVEARRIVLNGVRVIVADDDPDALLIYAYALRRCGADVITVDSARSAFETVLTLRPDVIVSDIAMRDRDGYWLLNALRSSGNSDGADVPVLAVTAFGDSHSRTRVLSSGFQDYLAKPVDPDELCRAVARLARR